MDEFVDSRPMLNRSRLSYKVAFYRPRINGQHIHVIPFPYFNFMCKFHAPTIYLACGQELRKVERVEKAE